jgi:hypothetical protein
MHHLLAGFHAVSLQTRVPGRCLAQNASSVPINAFVRLTSPRLPRYGLPRVEPLWMWHHRRPGWRPYFSISSQWLDRRPPRRCSRLTPPVKMTLCQLEYTVRPNAQRCSSGPPFRWGPHWWWLQMEGTEKCRCQASKSQLISPPPTLFFKSSLEGERLLATL